MLSATFSIVGCALIVNSLQTAVVSEGDRKGLHPTLPNPRPYYDDEEVGPSSW